MKLALYIVVNLKKKFNTFLIVLVSKGVPVLKSKLQFPTVNLVSKRTKIGAFTPMF